MLSKQPPSLLACCDGQCKCCNSRSLSLSVVKCVVYGLTRRRGVPVVVFFRLYMQVAIAPLRIKVGRGSYYALVSTQTR